MAPARETLVERLQRNDPTAAAELVSTYHSRIYQLALKYVRNHEDAEEVTQDVFLKVCRNAASFRGEAALTSWMHRITFNAAISHLRRSRSRNRVMVPRGHFVRADGTVEGMPDVPDTSPAADERLVSGELRQRLVSAVNDLPDLYREPVVLRDIRGLTTEEATARLKVKNQTLKSRLHRGRLMLRQRLADLAGGFSLRPEPAA
jgi:RNA polymerase sigma-70 factor (ECF subfamily)